MAGLLDRRRIKVQADRDIGAHQCHRIGNIFCARRNRNVLLPCEIQCRIATGDDPVAAGLVATLNGPGGNLTGVTIFGMMAAGKRLELLRQLMPTTGTIAYLMNPNNPNREFDNVQAAARSVEQQILVLNADGGRAIDTAFATIAQQGVAALLVASDPLFFDRREQLIALAARQAIPAIYYLRAFSQAGGLLSYGNNLTDMYRQVGAYTGRILNGERPADLPVMQSTKFELVINLKTAKALGLEIPPTLITIADEVIE